MCSNSQLVVQFTFYHARHLPIGDWHNLRCDPYIEVELYASQRERKHKLTFRTPTLRKTRDPIWTVAKLDLNPSDQAKTQLALDGNTTIPSQCRWVVGGISASSVVTLRMHCRDEDSGRKDDSLGIASSSFFVPDYTEVAEREEVRECDVKKRRSSFNVYVQTYLAKVLSRMKLEKHASIILGFEVLRVDERRSPRPYTLGPNRWTQHFSPLIGHVIQPRHEPPSDQLTSTSVHPPHRRAPNTALDPHLASPSFVANKIQLSGPPPSVDANMQPLRVSKSPKTKLMEAIFARKGFRGGFLNQVTRYQHRTVYSYDRMTRYGVVGVPSLDSLLQDRTPFDGRDAIAEEPGPLDFVTQFLRLVSYGEGGRVFTYAITLDGEWRFTETGEEFAIDLLSKHAIHSNLAQDILWSGEFFVRRFVDRPGGGFTSAVALENCTTLYENTEVQVEEDDVLVQGPRLEHDQHIPDDPKKYELVIDNDSGTYRPPKDKLNILRDWLREPQRLGGLGNVTVVDGFDKAVVQVKKRRREVRISGIG